MIIGRDRTGPDGPPTHLRATELSRASSEINASNKNTTADPANGSPITTRTPHNDAK
jgi:hypothetical protein